MATRPFNRPHLFVRQPPATTKFTSTRAGGSKPKFKQHDRVQHGQKLSSEFENALPDNDEEDAIVRVEFQSEPGFDLQLKSLDSSRKDGFELLAVRKVGEVTFATVQIPRATLKHFRNVFEAYISKNTKKGSPRHQALVESIAKIRTAGLASLWTDLAEFPKGTEPLWWEVWLRRTETSTVDFRESAKQLDIQLSEKQIIFVDRVATLAFATVDQLGSLLEETDKVAEVRQAKQTPTDFMQLAPADQARTAEGLARRISQPSTGSPSVCVLDTGVNSGHVLLKPALADSDLLSCNPTWGVSDHAGHGTEMAGLALLGDLVPLLTSDSPVKLTHGLESVKILPPVGQNRPELYGAITLEAVSRAEVQAPQRTRSICMAITATDNRDRGQPSSWSSAVDQLTSGADDDVRRLICISAGNANADNFLNYPISNQTDSVHDPGQSWNAVTVGALADREQITEVDRIGWSPLAGFGDLGPSSTSSLTWDRRWPIKPDILMPGGNVAVDPGRTRTDPVDSLSLLTTHRHPQERQFSCAGETSAATALASRLAAQVHARYPNLWPETVRALLIHSAAWTPAMMKRFPAKGDCQNRLRLFGFGVPDAQLALSSADNSATLVIQQEIQPFGERLTKTPAGGKTRAYVSNEMHLHKLPWPTAALDSLGNVDIELRITLSYFVEPSPGRRGWKHDHRYASHGLRFDVQTSTETAAEFLVRINKAAREEDEKPETSGDAADWALGPNLRSLGSIHSDIWTGPAVELARRTHVAVFPSIGWWRERHQLGKWNKKTRYALLVSIRAPEVETDIYTAIATEIGVPVTVS